VTKSHKERYVNACGDKQTIGGENRNHDCHLHGMKEALNCKNFEGGFSNPQPTLYWFSTFFRVREFF
jgi:hypothetical protein